MVYSDIRYGDVNYHRLKPVACERLSETKQLD